MPNLEKGPSPAISPELKKARAKTDAMFMHDRIKRLEKPVPGETEYQKERRLEQLVATEEELREEKEKTEIVKPIKTKRGAAGLRSGIKVEASAISGEIKSKEEPTKAVTAEEDEKNPLEKLREKVLGVKQKKPSKELRDTLAEIKKPGQETEDALGGLKAIEEERVKKGEKLEKPKKEKLEIPKTELEESLAEIKKLGADKIEENAEALKKVRTKIREAPPTEVLTAVPTEKDVKIIAEEPGFDVQSEAWFKEGAGAEKARNRVKELEKDVRILKRAGKETMTKIAAEDLHAAKEQTVEGLAQKRSSRGIAPEAKREEPAAVKEARKKLEDLGKKLEDAAKKLDDEHIDAANVTGGWTNRIQIKLQLGIRFFSKKSKEIDALYDAYVKAKKECAKAEKGVFELTASSGDASKQQLRGLAASGRKTPPGGPFGRP